VEFLNVEIAISSFEKDIYFLKREGNI